MRPGLSLDQIFPIRDAASARLGRVKADCLLDAGVIDWEDHRQVYARAAALLTSASPPLYPAHWPTLQATLNASL